jgi:hypothetical protein
LGGAAGLGRITGGRGGTGLGCLSRTVTGFGEGEPARLASRIRSTTRASDGFNGGPERIAPMPSRTNSKARLIARASAMPDARLRSGVSSCAERRR